MRPAGHPLFTAGVPAGLQALCKWFFAARSIRSLRGECAHAFTGTPSAVPSLRFQRVRVSVHCDQYEVCGIVAPRGGGVNKKFFQ